MIRILLTIVKNNMYTYGYLIHCAIHQKLMYATLLINYTAINKNTSLEPNNCGILSYIRNLNAFKMCIEHLSVQFSPSVLSDSCPLSR